MVDDVPVLQGKMVVDNSPGDLPAVPGFNVSVPVTSLKEREIAVLGTKMMFLLPDSRFSSHDFNPAYATGYGDSVFCGVYPLPFEQFEDALAGDSIPSCNRNHGFQLDHVGVYNVNLLFDGQSNSLFHGFTPPNGMRKSTLCADSCQGVSIT
uniref:Uncharacterized protein n=1 Tax=viral metagenome TaxID=1070528 RepID=A0A6M3IFH1_9ZZZZ